MTEPEETTEKPTRAESSQGETREAQLVADAQDFFEAGGVLSWGEWSAFDPTQKGAFRVAKQADEVDRLTRLALALSGEEGLAEIAAPLDDGDAIVALALDRAMDRVVAREEGRNGDAASMAHFQRAAHKAAREVLIRKAVSR